MKRVACVLLALVIALGTALEPAADAKPKTTTHDTLSAALQAETEKEEPNMKKQVCTVLLTMMLTLNGCGGDTEPAVTDTTTTATTTTTVAAATTTTEDVAEITTTDSTTAIDVEITTTDTELQVTTTTSAPTTKALTTTKAPTTTAKPTTTAAPVVQTTTTTTAPSTTAAKNTAEQTQEALRQALVDRGGQLDVSLSDKDSATYGYYAIGSNKAFTAAEATSFWEKNFKNATEPMNVMVSYADNDRFYISVLLKANYNDPWEWPCDWQDMEADCKAYVESQGWHWDANLNVDKGSWAGFEMTYNQKYKDQFETVKNVMHIYNDQSGDTYFKCVFIPDEDHDGHYHIYIVHGSGPTPSNMPESSLNPNYIDLAKKAVN